MKKPVALILLGLFFTLANAGDALAEIKEIRMKIAGSLCGY